MKNPDEIPLYSAEGNCIGTRTRQGIKFLAEANRVTVSYARKGNIRRAVLKQVDGMASVLETVYTGTRYSFNEKLPTGHRAWKHRPLPKKGSADVFVRNVFREVALGCISA